MKCRYLSIYEGESFSWRVAVCKARQGRYVPSVADLEKTCRARHDLCPYYQQEDRHAVVEPLPTLKGAGELAA